jgi:alkanesulfonate monooxygenase SsuD/methylene tetrahydromethanopterin reductase-like flavin-dependent oxidoreductase (luciferase family)
VNGGLRGGWVDKSAPTPRRLPTSRGGEDREHPAHHGPFVDFDHVDAHPRPAQAQIPVIVGGHTTAAYRRAVRDGAGWYGFNLPPEETAEHVAGLRETAGRTERRRELGKLELSVTPRGRLTPESVAAFAALGVDRLVFRPKATVTNVDDLISTIESAATAVTA